MGSSTPLAERLIAGITYSIFALIGLFINLLVVFSLYKNHKVFSKFPFYTLAKHLLFASIGQIIFCQFIVAIPISFTGKSIYGESTFLIILSSGDTLFFLAMFFTSFYIALNRLLAVFTSRLYTFLFTGLSLYIVCSSVWVISTSWVIITTAIGCPKVFLHDGFYFTYRCDENLSKFGAVFMSISKYMGYTIPAIMLIIYCLILWKVRKITKNDTHILIQSLFICVPFEMETILFTFLPKLQPDVNKFWLTLFSNLILIFSATTTSLILLLFNPVIKQTVMNIFTCSQKSSNDDSDMRTNYRVYDVSDDYGRHARENRLPHKLKQKASRWLTSSRICCHSS